MVFKNVFWLRYNSTNSNLSDSHGRFFFCFFWTYFCFPFSAVLPIVNLYCARLKTLTKIQALVMLSNSPKMRHQNYCGKLFVFDLCQMLFKWRFQSSAHARNVTTPPCNFKLISWLVVAMHEITFQHLSGSYITEFSRLDWPHYVLRNVLCLTMSSKYLDA